MSGPIRTRIASTPIVLALAAAWAVAQAAPPPNSSREIAEGLTVEAVDGTVKFERSDEPIYRFADPARGFTDGTIWAFGKVGRPVALFTIAREKRENGDVQWNHEFTSTSARPIVAANPAALGTYRWQPTPDQFSMKPLRGEPVASDDGVKRLRQLKALARRFSASELWTPIGQSHEGRFELRLLPQPIYRYSDPANGVLDGAIFLFSYGQNPEIALLIEATKQGGAPASWSYGFGRIAGARLLVRFDNQPIADLAAPAAAGPESAYGVAIRPISEAEAPRP